MFKFHFSLSFFILFTIAIGLQAQVYTQASDPECTIPTASTRYDFTAQLSIITPTVTTQSYTCGVGVSYAFFFDASLNLSGPNPPSAINADLVIDVLIDGAVVETVTIGNMSSTNIPTKRFSYSSWESGAFCGNTLTFVLNENSSIWNGPCVQGDNLPIQLGYFTPQIINDGTVKLQWQTLLEVDNDYFILSRSNDGKEWAEISRVQGSGNSRSAINYEYIDRTPFYGSNYYKLTQVDFDGVSETFPTKRIEIEASIDIHVFPNPISESVSIRGYYSKIDQAYLTDLQGNKIKLKHSHYLPGLNQYKVPLMAQGIYLFEAYDENDQQLLMRKVVINTKQ